MSISVLKVGSQHWAADLSFKGFHLVAQICRGKYTEQIIDHLVVVGPVGFEASVRILFTLGFIVHYYNRYKITLTDYRISY
jgi:hypothetical protein